MKVSGRNLCVMGIDFSIGLWNYSDSVDILFFISYQRFLMIKKKKKNTVRNAQKFVAIRHLTEKKHLILIKEMGYRDFFNLYSSIIVFLYSSCLGRSSNSGKYYLS